MAIREELASSLTEIGASKLGPPPSTTPSVSYFNPNDSGLFALVEQRVPADNGGHVLLELIVTAHGAEKHVVLEQVSRSEEHTSELQSLMRISYAVFCLKKKQTSHTLQKNTKTAAY